MNFRSDNVTGVAPEILAALAAANAGSAPSYGEDAITKRLAQRFAALFEHEVAVFPVATGTAANALALATLVPPWGVVYCHEAAHIQVDECGAPEFFAGGAKLMPLPGADAKLQPEVVEQAIAGQGVVHHAQPAAMSISEATEAGTLYRPEEVAALGALARRHRL
ncbi:MAG TPA: beta-eliminating lyase-related protein, partial [Stellaceae bacterium]|nr:beta-eliminating lyase-related protein [Stellaceae bacterium]